LSQTIHSAGEKTTTLSEDVVHKEKHETVKSSIPNQQHHKPQNINTEINAASEAPNQVKPSPEKTNNTTTISALNTLAPKPAAHEPEKDHKFKITQRLLQQFNMKRTNLLKQTIPLESFTVMVVKESFDCSINELFKTLFSDDPITYKGRQTHSFWYSLRAETGDIDISYTTWSPAPPAYYREFEATEKNIDDLLAFSGTSVREFKFVHPLREQIMFAPKTSTIEDKQTAYWLSHDEVMVQTESITSKVPFCDAFVARSAFHLKVVGEHKVELVWKFYMDFVKSCMFKGKILKSAHDEVMDMGSKKFVPLVRENLKNVMLDKQKKMKVKAASRRASIEGKERPSAVIVGKVEAKPHSEDELPARHGKTEEISTEPASAKSENVVERRKEEVESPGTEEEKEVVVRKKSSFAEKGSRFKYEQNGVVDNISEELRAFLKSSESIQKEMRDEMKMIKMLLMVMMAVNILLIGMLFRR